MKRIAILYDSIPAENRLTAALARASGAAVDAFGIWFPARRTAVWRYLVQTPLMLLFPLGMLGRLGRFDVIYCWQQNFGIVLGLVIRLLALRSHADIHVLGFIATARRRQWPLRPLIGFALGCRAIKTIVCFNTAELALYRATFPDIRTKFRTTLLAEAGIDAPVADDGYFLAAGRENRDYAFLLSCFARWPERRLVVVSDTLGPVDAPNIAVHSATYGAAYVDMVARCHAVVFAFQDPNISSGQLVFLQALKLGKPVIATKSGCLAGYLIDDENGLAIAKDPAALDKAIAALADPVRWREMANTQMADHAARFAMDSFAERIIAITTQR
jgi:glycosyltransferase involved in cell wall biosynthesis